MMHVDRGKGGSSGSSHILKKMGKRLESQQDEVDEVLEDEVPFLAKRKKFHISGTSRCVYV